MRLVSSFSSINGPSQEQITHTGWRKCPHLQLVWSYIGGDVCSTVPYTCHSIDVHFNDLSSWAANAITLALCNLHTTFKIKPLLWDLQVVIHRSGAWNEIILKSIHILELSRSMQCLSAEVLVSFRNWYFSSNCGSKNNASRPCAGALHPKAWSHTVEASSF